CDVVRTNPQRLRCRIELAPRDELALVEPRVRAVVRRLEVEYDADVVRVRSRARVAHEDVGAVGRAQHEDLLDLDRAVREGELVVERALLDGRRELRPRDAALEPDGDGTLAVLRLTDLDGALERHGRLEDQSAGLGSRDPVRHAGS